MAEWSADDPGAGETSALEHRVAKLGEQRDHASDIQQLVSRRADQVGGAWHGSAHAAWAHNAAGSVVAWARLHTWADNEKQALRRYVDAVESIKERAERQKRLMAAARDEASRPLHFLDAQLLARRLQDRSADLLATTASTTAALSALALERQAAEDDLARSLHTVHLEVDRAGHAILPAGMSLARLASLDRSSLLAAMSELSATELDDLMSADPSLTQDFWNDPPPADDVAAWWASLTEQQQSELIAGAPSIIGNLGGVPYAARIDANRLQLEAADLRDDLTAEQRAAVTAARSTLDSLDTKAGKGLIDFNLTHRPPLVALALGDMDSAATVTWSVPGMNTRAADIRGWAGPALNLLREQDKIESASHAVVAWIGYEAPTLDGTKNDPTGRGSVLMNTLAEAGSRRLTRELDALPSARRTDPPRVSVVAHSYGTTTAAYALTKTTAEVASATFIASAGIDSSKVPRAESLHVSSVGGRPAVFSTQAKADLVATAGRSLRPDVLDSVEKSLTRVDASHVPANHRINPDESFGATVFGSDGSPLFAATEGHDATGSGGAPFVTAPKGHGYFDSRTQALRNVAVSSTGRGRFIANEAIPSVSRYWPRL